MLTQQTRVVTDANFDAEVLRSPVPVLVDFWAQWCPPCRMLSPVVEEIATEMGEAVRVVKIDVEESPELTRRFQVKSIPLLLFFKDGEVRDQLVGAMAKSTLQAKLEALL